MIARIVAVCVFLMAASLVAAEPGELQAPVQVQAGGKPVDVEREGHAAPFVGDFDGDGVWDLLVGEFHEGRLRIYRNLGTNQQPRFAEPIWLQAAGKTASVPVG